ncbi:protein of unknown function (plasmid) [Caballeronia sp. S22]
MSGAIIAALRAHWQDRSRDFDAPQGHGPLIAQQWIPPTRPRWNGMTRIIFTTPRKRLTPLMRWGGWYAWPCNA